MRVGIIAAMQPELTLLQQKTSLIDSTKFHGFTFDKGRLKNVEVILVKCGVGKVAAAAASTLLIDKFSPDYIINTGSAGGFDENLNVGDVVVATELRHHDVDVTPFGFEYGQVFDMPAAYPCDPALIQAATKALQQIPDINVAKGLICTGDSFMYQTHVIDQARERFPTMKAAEMEGAAIAQTCFILETPFLVVRALSDIAGKESHTSFEQFLPLAAERSATMLMSMLNEL